ncbi:preprotein translocase subunit SecE [Candidatus Saccharibacteria bacterium]|nr:preprotein translocase subunit SecE [Candidatus Saccharibacteria bacterium]
MANGPLGRRKPRIRKPAPTVREKIESGAKAAEAKPKRRVKLPVKKAIGPLAPAQRAIKSALRPLAPIGKVLLKILGWLVPRYFVNSWRELRMVTWPGRRETWRLTGAVFVFAVVFGALVAGVDYVLDQAFKRFILR